MMPVPSCGKASGLVRRDRNGPRRCEERAEWPGARHAQTQQGPVFDTDQPGPGRPGTAQPRPA
jgi:hypothetical protein